MDNKKSVFETLNSINCNEHVEKKNGLSYLSWAWAWAEVKKAFPGATYTIYENPQGWNYFSDGNTCWVKTGVTIEGIEHIEELPVMDYKNRSIPLGNVTSYDINKSIQRSLTKACARHGLGLYIYAGEDLPEGESVQVSSPSPKKYIPVGEKTYWKIIAAYAQGKKTKSGGDYKETWIQMTNAGEGEIAEFNHDVENWLIANVPSKDRRLPADHQDI